MFRFAYPALLSLFILVAGWKGKKIRNGSKEAKTLDAVYLQSILRPR